MADNLREIPSKVLEKDWGAMSPAEQRSYFSQNGFLVVPGAFSPSEIQTMFHEIDERDLDDKSMDMSEAFCSTPSMAAMIENPRIVSAVKAAIGEDVICFKGAYVPKKSREVGSVRPHRSVLHMDYGICEDIGDFRNSNAHWVNVACYLTDMTVEHAPFAVVPGSHSKTHLGPQSDLEELSDEAVTVLAKAGDALVFMHNTVHAGGVNVSGKTQRILFCSYRAAWARHIGQVDQWPADFLAKSPPERKSLISDLNRGTLSADSAPWQKKVFGRLKKVLAN